MTWDIEPPPTREELRRALMVTMKRLRKETGTTQAELAKRSGVNHVYLGGLERGEHSPTIDMLHRLLSAMNISYVRFASEFT